MALKSLDEEKDAKYEEKYECCFLFLVLSLFPTVTKLFFYLILFIIQPVNCNF